MSTDHNTGNYLKIGPLLKELWSLKCVDLDLVEFQFTTYLKFEHLT